MRFNNHARRAFSLIDVMIIGLLAGVVPYATTNYMDKAKRQKARSDIATYSGAVDAFYLDKSRFPTNQEGLKILVPEFVKLLQNDPWGRPYLFVQPGKNGKYDIISYGADGREGGAGE